MLIDVVHWKESGAGCDRCGQNADHYIHPYWDTPKRVCGQCCSELNRIYDAHGWPPGAPG